MQKVIIIALTFLVCISCEKDITDDFRRSNDRRIALSGEFVALERPMVHVSRTISMVDLDSIIVIEDAILELHTEDDTYLMNHVGDGYYTTDGVIMEPGKSYTLNCSVDGLREASALIEIPDVTDVTDLIYTVDTAYYMYINFDFTDNVETEDYYSYYLSGWGRERRYTPYIEEDNIIMIIDTINVFSIFYHSIQDSIAEYSGGLGIFTSSPFLYEITDRSIEGRRLFFSDKEINGQSYNLAVKINLLNCYNDSIPEIELTFQRQDRHLLEYLKVLEKYNPDPDFPIMQPVQLYSNIEGGFGLVYAISEYKHTIDVSEWYNDPLFLEWLNNPR